MPDQIAQSPESLLAESEARYRALFDNASDMIQSVRPDGTFEFVNRAWHTTLGFSEEDMAGMVIWDIIYPESMQECQMHFMQVMQGTALTGIRTTFMNKAGEPIPVEGSAQPRFVDDQLVATHAFFSDISERLRTEALEARNRELEREQQARFLEKMAALGKLSAGLSHELNNPAAAASRAAQRLDASLDARDAATRDLVAGGVGPDGFAQLEAVVAECAHSSVATALSPLEASRAEDEVQDWLADHGVAEPWTHAATFVNGGVTVVALDRLKASLPAGAVAPAIAWIGETLALREHAGVVARSTERISKLVGAVKSYSFRDQATEQDVDIHDGLENTLTILAYQLKSMTVERDYEPSIPPIRTYGSGLNQVWTNILDNAVDATNGTGTITITTRQEGDLAVVEIADDGCGIPPEHLSRIFEPFYTTKVQGEGTGLGLDIAWRIVTEEHRGTLAVDSRPGKTTFRVAVPICPEFTTQS